MAREEWITGTWIWSIEDKTKDDLNSRTSVSPPRSMSGLTNFISRTKDAC
jgi:hypothetical protein